MTVTKEVRKRKLKISLIVIGSVLAAIIAATGICAIITAVGNAANIAKAQSFDRVVIENQLTPVEDGNGYWTFTTDRDFKVMQFTDIHIGGGFISQQKDSWAINAVAAMITYEKPDLVIVTGDIVYPVPFQAGTFNNLAATKIFIALMEQLGVYWTFAFGNHDTEVYSYYSRKQIAEYYEEQDFEYCLFKRGPDDVDGEGNQVINVKNTLGLITQSFILLDSHSYIDRDYFGIKWRYDNIHPNQIDWYADVIAELNAENITRLGELEAAELPENPETFEIIKSLLFFHIPLIEYKDAWTEYVDNGNADTDNVSFVYGFSRETGKIVFAGVGEDELFETVYELGSTKGIFCGHDHLNNFSLTYYGIKLTYGMSIDYLAYSGIHRVGAQRGCTIIITDSLGNFECHNENYYQDKYATQYDKEVVNMD
ncbi:MAG: hypothetical protein EOM87_06330 [Clostridia bacterium]|nr:hypothetical protein [Clostridia bacterium]